MLFTDLGILTRAYYLKKFDDKTKSKYDLMISLYADRLVRKAIEIDEELYKLTGGNQ